MTKELDDLLNEIFPLPFPSVSSETTQRAKGLIAQHADHPERLFATALAPVLAQGDILLGVPFYAGIPPKTPGVVRTGAMVLSNTCDVAQGFSLGQGRKVMLCQVVDAKILEEGGFGALAEAKRNQVNNLFRLPGKGDYSEFIADFSTAAPFDAAALKKRLEDGKYSRALSLSDFGYFFFLTKLTVFLMRPETHELQREKLPDDKGL